MKKTAILALFALTAVAARAGDEQGLIGKVHALPEIRACIQDANTTIYQVSGMVTATGICKVSGETHRVDLIKSPFCNPSGAICPAAPTVIIASVEFGCENEVLSAVCY